MPILRWKKNLQKREGVLFTTFLCSLFFFGGGKWVGGEKKAKIENDDEVTCYACNGKFSSEEKCRDHCCQNIKDLVCETIDNIGDDYDIGKKTLKEAVSYWVDKN